jgi:D-tyrosyl-tRNA(Tyr) deacylase
MIAIVQRVTQASVTVENEIVGQIDHGLMVLVSVHREDGVEDVAWMAQKLAGLRIFRNGEKHYDLDVRQVGGGILLVSNFTVAADTRQGRRPSLSNAADPGKGREYFEKLVVAVREQGVKVETGRFQAAMRVALVNDGPSTFIVDSRAR